MAFWWTHQGTAGGWGSLYGNNTLSQTATTSTLYAPTTIWWSQTGTSTPTITTSTWSSATNDIYYQHQLMRAHTLRQLGQLQMYPHVNQAELARRLYENQMGQEAQTRQVMAAPAILRARKTPIAQRAIDLLLSFLSDEQRRTFGQHGWFIVVGGQSGRRYRIRGGTYAGNVDLLAANDNYKVEARFCGHCDASIPLGDQLLAQKVMLEVDEPAYIALANRRAA